MIIWLSIDPNEVSQFEAVLENKINHDRLVAENYQNRIAFSQITFCKPNPIELKKLPKELNLIPWAKGYCLSWDVFRGSVDVNDTFDARTYTETMQYFDIKPVTSSETEFEFSKIKIIPYFVTNTSWVKKSVDTTKDYVLLRHEQGHFDVAQEHASNAESKIKAELMGKRFPFEPQTDNRTNDARTQAQILLNNAWSKIYPELNQTNAKYDNETNHGKIISIQNKYNNKFDKLRQ